MEALIFFFIFLLTLTFVKWYLKRRENFRRFEKLGIPGPKPSFLFGNCFDLIRLGKKFEVDWFLKYGPIYGYFFGTTPIVVVLNPEFLKIIEVKKAQIFHRRNSVIPNAAVPNPVFKFSTSVNSGPIWKEARDMITPTFTTSKLKTMTNAINQTIEENWKEMKEIIENKETLDVKEIFSTTVADITFKTLFGIKINEKKRVVQSLNYAFDTNLINPINFISLCLPEVMNVFYYIRVWYHTVKYYLSSPSMLDIYNMCQDAISARLSVYKSNYIDLLQHMIDPIFKKKKVIFSQETENSESKTEKSLLTEIDCISNSFYAAVTAYDTIRNPVIFATYYIAKYPEIQERIREEISQYNNKEETIDYSTLSKLKYLDQVFCETLRMFPPAPNFINRVAEEDYVYKNILIPKNMTIIVPQYGLHRNPVYWTDPDEFKPERFEDKSNINPYIYQPFGIGPRHCSGMRLGQLIVKLILANLVKSFKFSLCPETNKLEPSFDFVVTHSKHPVYIKATPN
ncbi:cytochrome P450 3A6-like isoform X1 [Centruroides sculpturatus]|uniref:cytochrome P450 3A6-like isoform X1 n=1 Tax=Centruroides sculpturatus TaxID=218467 RepID=UPI000C6E48B6|nr:cytochrome P450 3A6-like isoform X1 [Centruroides sculpturatus]